MFGAYRYFLALLVVVAHTCPGFQNWSGVYAVFGFFVLSGYLMTLILHETYGLSVEGIGRYALNRVARIYPAYWLILVLSIFLILLFPVTSKSLNGALALPRTLLGFLDNLFIFGLGNTFFTKPDAFRIIPPAWTLHIELIFYLLIPFLAKSKRTTTYWFLASLALLFVLIFTGADFNQRYRPIQAATLPFSAGALTYFLTRKKKKASSVNFMVPLFLLIAIVLNIILAGKLADPWTYPFYINLVLQIILVGYLGRIDRASLPRKIKSGDKFLGDLSYPIYLSYWMILILVSVLFWNGTPPDKYSPERLKLFGQAFFFLHVFVILFTSLFEGRIQTIRDRIRGKKLTKS